MIQLTRKIRKGVKDFFKDRFWFAKLGITIYGLMVSGYIALIIYLQLRK